MTSTTPLQAVQHVRRMRGGAQSHLMRGSDGGYWIVKFQNNPQHIKVLANDFLASRIGSFLGLPTPQVAAIEVSDWLIENTPELRIESAGMRIPCRSGLQLASRYIADPEQDAVFDYLPETMFKKIINMEDFPRCLVLDKWTGNADGRQVVFSRPSRYVGYKAHFIDQGYCFNAGEWTFPDLALHGVYYRNFVYQHVTRWQSFEPALSRAEQADIGDLWTCASQMPREWYQGDRDGLSRLIETMCKRRSSVRDLITAFRESTRNPFPNWTDAPSVFIAAAIQSQQPERRAERGALHAKRRRRASSRPENFRGALTPRPSCSPGVSLLSLLTFLFLAVPNVYRFYRPQITENRADRIDAGRFMTKRNDRNDRRFWVVSPNVANDYRTVKQWKASSVRLGAAFMGYPPNDKGLKRLGSKFANEIKSGDIILIARRHHHQPDIVGFGVVYGKCKTQTRTFRPPAGQKFGSMRKLTPFVAKKKVPGSLNIMAVLGHTAALRKIRRQRHRQLCNWLERQLGIRGKARRDDATQSQEKSATIGAKAMLGRMPEDDQLDYKFRTRRTIARAKKLEARLLKEYRDWLSARGRNLKTVKTGRLRCDGYEIERGNLIEAKSRPGREYIRMAVGQLFDYAFLGKSVRRKPRLAILLPNKPPNGTIDWLKPLKISIVWKEKNKFTDNAKGRFS